MESYFFCVVSDGNVFDLSCILSSDFRNPLLFLDFIYFNFSPQGWEFSRLCKFVHGIAEDIIKARKKTIVSTFYC